MSMFQSIEVPMTTNNTATLAGNLNVSNGQGNGRFILSARRVLSTRGLKDLFDVYLINQKLFKQVGLNLM